MDYLIHHMLCSSAIRFPDREALVHGSARLTYCEVARNVCGLAVGLRSTSMRRGDRIGIYLDPSIPQALSIFGVAQSGGVYVTINSALFPDQVAHIVRDCQMKGLITAQSKLKLIEPVLAQIPTLEFVIIVNDQPAGETSLKAYDFEEMCRLPTPREWRDDAIEKDLAALLYTSGSTGKPKGVMLSHANVMAGSSIVSTYLGITHEDRILAVLPFSFDAGMNQIMTAFQQGGALVMTTFTFAREIVAKLLDEHITGLAGVPTLWNLIAQPNSSLQKNKFPALRYITNTGGAMPQPVLAVLRQALPTTRIFLMYGLTEAFRSTYLPPEELDRRPTSMGRAIPNTEILVVDEDGRRCGSGEVGELVHRGPTVSMGYWGQSELTSRVLRPNPFLLTEIGDAEKVCYSGDLVKMDEEGFLYFVGRRDTMIKSSGFRISPTEIEEVLFQSGHVKEAAVIGIPDEILGQSIKAFVSLKEGAQVDVIELLRFCGDKLPRYMLPKSIEVLSTLPKTPSSKVDYPALRKSVGV